MINYIVEFMAGCIIALVFIVVKLRKELKNSKDKYSNEVGYLRKHIDISDKQLSDYKYRLKDNERAIRNLNGNIEKVRKHCGMTIELDFDDLAKGASAVEIKRKGEFLGRVER